MHDAVRVRERDGIEDAAEHRAAGSASGSAIADQIVEPAALDQLHHVEGAAVGERAGVVNGHDAGMIEPGQDVRFALQPRRARAFLIGDVEHLHRDVAIEDVIAGDVDGAHAAVAGDAGDLVARIELGPRRRIAQAIDRAIGDHRRPAAILRASFARFGFPLLVARRQLAQPLEHDLPELPPHRGQVIGHGRCRQIQRRGDRRVRRPRVAIVDEVVAREHLEHLGTPGVLRVALEIGHRSLEQRAHPFAVEQLVDVGADRGFVRAPSRLRRSRNRAARS